MLPPLKFFSMDLITIRVTCPLKTYHQVDLSLLEEGTESGVLLCSLSHVSDILYNWMWVI